MREQIFRVSSNKKLTNGVYEMRLSGDTSELKLPGQFVNILLDGFFLRRPFSVCEWDNEELCLVYKTVGGGTEYMSQLADGAELKILTGLGNGFDLSLSGQKPLLVGGGGGIAPLRALASRLLNCGASPTVILGFNTESEIFYEDIFKSLGCEVIVTTVDGSHGVKGFASDGITDVSKWSFMYVCGPMPMLKAVYGASGNLDGQFSFEARMACGYGACMGCSIITNNGYKRVCKDGPVFDKGAIAW